MKKIMLAKKGKRILARLIDLSIVFILTMSIYVIFVFPNTFNINKYNETTQQITDIILDSGLFVVDEDVTYIQKSSSSSFMSIEKLYSTNVENVNVKEVSLTKSLYEFYTEKLNLIDGNLINLNYDSYCSSILKVGTEESNIKSYDGSTHTFTLINENTPDVTILFFLNQYDKACAIVSDSKLIENLSNSNNALIIDSTSWIIYIYLIFTFIFDLLIPMFSKESQTIGKHIFGLAVVSKDGYHYKKINNIMRFIVYAGVEVILGVLTFGGTFLISYTLFLFKKNRCCLHDMIAKSVVIDAKESFIFASAVEEKYYEERSKRRGTYYG